MSKSNAFETELLLLLFNNTDIPNIGDAAGLQNSATTGSLYLSLHTADPGEGGTQATNEISYTGYARKAVARTGAEWSVSGPTVTLVNNQDFPESTGGAGGLVTHWAVGKESAGATVILYKGTTDPDITVSSGVTPRMKAGTTVTED